MNAEATFYELNLDDVPEEELIDPSEGEVLLEIISMRERVSEETGTTWIEATLKAAEFPDAPLITHRLFLPNGKDDPGSGFKLRRIKDFWLKFELKYDKSKIHYESARGQKAWCILKIEKSKDEAYPDKNVIARIISSAVK